MSRLSDHLRLTQEIQNAKLPARKHPDGWEPGVRWDEATRTGAITVKSNKPAPDWSSLLLEWGFDPERFKVVDDTIQFRTWDANIGDGNVQRFYYYRAQIATKLPDSDPDVERLIKLIAKRTPKTPALPTTGGSFVAALADWQIGQRGTEQSIERIMRLVDEIPARWHQLRKSGVELHDIVLVGLGDLVEGCEGWYAAQQFQVELNEREQRTVVRRLLVKLIETCADLAPTRVAVIGGNHGEARRGGKSFTDSGDNADVEVAEQAAEIFAANPAYADRVTFVIPRDELSLTLDVSGTIVGITHGHLAKRGAGAANKVENWWKGQALGMQPLMDGQLLLSGHYHHLLVNTIGPRTHIQAPAMCGASAWFTDMTGIGDSQSGTLTLVVGGGSWDHLKVLAR